MKQILLSNVGFRQSFIVAIVLLLGLLSVSSKSLGQTLVTHSAYTTFNSSPYYGRATSLWMHIQIKLLSNSLPNNGDSVVFTGGTITLNGVTSNPMVTGASIPSGKIIADQTVSRPVTYFNSATNMWITKVPPGYANSSIFISGAIINSSNGFTASGYTRSSVISGYWYSNRGSAFTTTWAYSLQCYQPIFTYASIAAPYQVASVAACSTQAGTPIPESRYLVSGGSTGSNGCGGGGCGGGGCGGGGSTGGSSSDPVVASNPPATAVCSFSANGSALQTGSQNYILTTGAGNQAGSVFSNATLDLTEDFTVDASLNFGTNASGGDGIAFVMEGEGPTYLGNSGAGLGYHRFDGSNSCMPTDQPGPVNSFIAEFDTYQNGFVNCQDMGDLASDHFAFMSHSNAYHTSQYALSSPVAFSSSLKDGQYHEVSLTWNADFQTMTVVVSLANGAKQTFTYNGDIINAELGGNNIVYWGFTAGNGNYSPNPQSIIINTTCITQTSSNHANSYKHIGHNGGNHQQTNTTPAQPQTETMSVQSETVRTGMSVSPNPSTGLFKVRVGEADVVNGGKIIVTNANGAVIQSKDISILQKGENVFDFDLTKCARGIYFVSLRTAGKQEMQKVVIY